MEYLAGATVLFLVVVVGIACKDFFSPFLDSETLFSLAKNFLYKVTEDKLQMYYLGQSNYDKLTYTWTLTVVSKNGKDAQGYYIIKINDLSKRILSYKRYTEYPSLSEFYK